MTIHHKEKPAISHDQALQQALSLHRAGRLQEAERGYRTVLRMHPRNPDANYNMGVLALQDNQTTTALFYFKTALTAAPDNALYRLSHIEALIRAGRYNEARQSLEQARRLGLPGESPDTLVARLDGPPPDDIDKLAAKFKQGRYSEARVLARRMTEHFPQYGFGWKVLGAALLNLGMTGAALEANQKAAELLPKDVEVLNNLGSNLKELSRISEAEACFRQAMEIDPDFIKERFPMVSPCDESGSGGTTNHCENPIDMPGGIS